jgi:Cys-rich protein (TIGR01571 family)
MPPGTNPCACSTTLGMLARNQAGGLGGCFQDLEVCFWGTFCSWCLYGQIKARTGRAPDCTSGCMELAGVQMGIAVVGSVITSSLVSSATYEGMEAADTAIMEANAINNLFRILAYVS